MEFTTYGGISILNAIPALVGAAMAISLEAKAHVEPGSCEMDEFAKFIINYASRALSISGDYCAKVESNIPSSSGLKSNSAVASAIIYALAHEAGIGLKPIEAAALAAEATKAHGSSITGAFDDASASVLGGITVTDNSVNRLIMHANAPEEVTIVITGHRGVKALNNIDSLRGLAPLFNDLIPIVLRGDYFRAATINGLLVAEALGYYRELFIIGKALSMGALASGVSGNGPSVYAIFKDGEEGPFIDFVESLMGYYIRAKPIGVRFSEG